MVEQKLLDRVIEEQKRLTFQRWKAQAKMRGEAVELTLDDWHTVWGDLWFQRGRGIDDYCLTRKDWNLPWSRDNVEILQRKEHFSTRSFKKRQQSGDSTVLGRKPVNPMEKF